MTGPGHVHRWRDTIVGCDDCGEHPAVICDGEDGCDEVLDLIYHDDPRDEETGREGN
jgi:hypothetical protein